MAQFYNIILIKLLETYVRDTLSVRGWKLPLIKLGTARRVRNKIVPNIHIYDLHSRPSNFQYPHCPPVKALLLRMPHTQSLNK